MKIFFTQKEVYDTHGQKCDTLEISYIDFYSSYFRKYADNIVTVPIPNNINALDSIMNFCHPNLIILTGGGDLNITGKQTNVDLCTVRQKVEKKILDYAILREIPVLGICRGAQFINIAFGGNIEPVADHVGVHAVKYENKPYSVNSFHNFGAGIKNLGIAIQPIVFAEDGIVEAFTVTNKKILGIQWHPERAEGNEELFDKIFYKHIGFAI